MAYIITEYSKESMQKYIITVLTMGVNGGRVVALSLLEYN